MIDLRIPGLPDWATLIVLVLGLMVALAWLLTPFSVFGVKGRIEAIEARLEVIHEEIRQLNVRIAQAGWRAGADFAMPAEPPLPRRPPAAMAEPQTSPPIPPPPVMPDRTAPDRTARAAPPPLPPVPSLRPEASRPDSLRPDPRLGPTLPPPGRAEPKLTWPPRG